MGDSRAFCSTGVYSDYPSSNPHTDIYGLTCAFYNKTMTYVGLRGYSWTSVEQKQQKTTKTSHWILLKIFFEFAEQILICRCCSIWFSKWWGTSITSNVIKRYWTYSIANSNQPGFKNCVFVNLKKNWVKTYFGY